MVLHGGYVELISATFPCTMLTLNSKTDHCFIFSDTGFIIFETVMGKEYPMPATKTILLKSSEGKRWRINGALCAHRSLRIYPREGFLRCNGVLGAAVNVGFSLEGEQRIAIIDTADRESGQKVLFKPVGIFAKIGPLFKKRSSLPRVRVLLEERKKSTPVMWTVQSDQGFIVGDCSGRKTKRRHISCASTLDIALRRGYWYIAGKRYLGKQIVVIPNEGYLTFGPNRYKGALFLVQDKDRAMLINSLSIEDYLYGVLRTEAWPGWPLEVNKVLAITSRTYALSMIRTACKKNALYHIKNTNEHQTYGGVHTCKIAKQAVDETRGIILAYGGEPIVAMFDACCGGLIPTHIEGIDNLFKQAPYLARDYACTHCKRCKIYTWRVSYQLRELESLFKKHMPTLSDLRTVFVHKKDKAGVVQEVTCIAGKSSLKIAKNKFYSMLAAVKSFCFSVTKESDAIIIDGRGYGHHLGLCQWGAREMVRDGWDYKRILDFYFPGVHYMRL